MLDISNQVNKFTTNNISPKDNFMMKAGTENGFFARSSGTVRFYGATEAFANHADVSWTLITTIDGVNQNEITISWQDFTGVYMESDSDTIVRICPIVGSVESYYAEIKISSLSDFENVPELVGDETNKALRVKDDGTLEWADLQDNAVVAPFPYIDSCSGIDMTQSNFMMEIEGSGFIPSTQIFIFKGFSSDEVADLEGFMVDNYVDMVAAGNYANVDDNYSTRTFFTSDGFVMNGEGHAVTKTDSSVVKPFAFINNKKIKVCLDNNLQGGAYCVVAVNPGDKTFVKKLGFYISEF